MHMRVRVREQLQVPPSETLYALSRAESLIDLEVTN